MTVVVDIDETAARQLLGPCRVSVFATRTVRRRGRAETVGCAWHGWNPDADMERQMARLRGAGSFYWPGAVRAVAAAKSMMRADGSISQVKVETISGGSVARIWRQS